MHKKAIVHLVTKARMKTDTFTYDIDMIEDLSHRYGIKNVIYYKGEEIEYKDLIKKLHKLGILLFNYSNKDDLKDKISELNKEYEVVFVNTGLELQINIVNELRAHLGEPVSDSPMIFRDKFLQRQLIQDHNPDLGIKFIKGTVEDLNIDEIEEYIGYPFIIKPTNGIQSSGVEKITSKSSFKEYINHYSVVVERLKGRGVDSKELIVEEFINGKLYSVDYYVSKEGNITMAKPIKEALAKDIGIDDYAVIARLSTEKTLNEFKGKRLKAFVNATVKATGIKNTFVHHELKINSKGELKTIELNGRLGGGRLEMYHRAYDTNMYELILDPDYKFPYNVKDNNIDVNIYATKRGILKSFNQELLDKISKRPSVFEVEISKSEVGNEIGLTRDGFIKIGVIKLRHSSYKEIRKDYLYIKSKYKSILEIEELPEEKEKKLIHKIKRIFKRKK